LKSDCHEQIQRYVNGLASPAEAAAMQDALSRDAELRALYLDYMNLDVALNATAETMTFAEKGHNGTATFPGPYLRSLPHSWRWFAAAATCTALIILVLLPRHRISSRARLDVAAISSTQSAIERLSVKPPSLTLLSLRWRLLPSRRDRRHKLRRPNPAPN
jgi:anti-sigma factor RsiW